MKCKWHGKSVWEHAVICLYIYSTVNRRSCLQPTPLLVSICLKHLLASLSFSPSLTSPPPSSTLIVQIWIWLIILPAALSPVLHINHSNIRREDPRLLTQHPTEHCILYLHSVILIITVLAIQIAHIQALQTLAEARWLTQLCIHPLPFVPIIHFYHSTLLRLHLPLPPEDHRW